MRRTLIVSAVVVVATATASGATADSRPSHPDAGGKIAFTSNRNGGQDEIVVANADGTGRVDLNAQGRFPELSPDGRKIAFSSVRDGNSEIYVMNAEGSGQTRLTFNTVYDSRPQWSADGRKLVFTRVLADGNWEIFRMNADGSNQVDLTNDPAFEWGQSTRGDRIVFTREEGGVGHIFEMNVEGKGVQRITNTPSYDSYPNLSPHGELVLFVRDTAGGAGDDIWVTRGNGRDERQLTHQSATGYIVAPTWSPDGSQIMYSQCGPGGANPCTLHVMNADGSADTDISTPKAPWEDTFTGEQLDSTWRGPFITGSGVSMTQTNGQLEVSLPSNAAPDPSAGYISIALNSQCLLAGDFDVQADYRLLNWQSPHGVNVGFATNTADFSSNYGMFVFDPGNGTGLSTGFPGPLNTFVPAPETSGTFRLTRIGSTLTAYRLVSGAWVPLQSTTATLADQMINLGVFSNAAPFTNTDVKVAYDNVRVSSGTFSCPSWWSDNWADWAPLSRQDHGGGDDGNDG